MKKKYVISVVVLALIVLLAYLAIPNAEEPTTKIPNEAVSYKPIKNQFYYDSLQQDERQALEEILKQLESGDGGKVHLSTPICQHSYNRIIQTIMFDKVYGYWPFVFAFPTDKNSKELPSTVLQDGKDAKYKNISDIYIQSYKDDTKRLKDFKFAFADDGDIITNGDEFQDVLKITDSDRLYYKKTAVQVDRMEDEIIKGMPKGLNKADAISYFNKWIMNNMVYDTAMEKKVLSPVTKHLVNLNTVSKASGRQCILDKKAICGGFSVVLSDLCNKVGIESYVVSGKQTQDVTEGYHAWVAVKIGKGTYYVDPTVSDGTKMDYGVWTKKEMEGGNPNIPKYDFLKYFDF